MTKITQSSGTRKRAVARARVKPGKGVVRVNGVLLEEYQPKYSRMRIQEPLVLAGDVIKKLDITVTVDGGGITGQSDAARLAIARSLIDHTGDDALKNAFQNYDRQLLVADVRFKETSKPNSHGKARAKRQKSYR